jgi:AcrR family transcriptional regulator
MPTARKPAPKSAKPPRKRRASRAPDAAADPRVAIMDAAERLCADHGLEAVSVRDIVAEAGVNLSAVNYYFGSRNNLLVSILRRRGAEIEAERARLLAEAGRKSPPQLKDIVRAMMTPLARWRMRDSGRWHALQFLSRALSASIPELKRLVDEGVIGFRPVIELLARALPHLSRDELCWRFHFMMSIEHMNQWDIERLQILSEGRCGDGDHEEELARAVDFIVAGFLAPALAAPRARRA